MTPTTIIRQRRQQQDAANDKIPNDNENDDEAQNPTDAATRREVAAENYETKIPTTSTKRLRSRDAHNNGKTPTTKMATICDGKNVEITYKRLTYFFSFILSKKKTKVATIFFSRWFIINCV